MRHRDRDKYLCIHQPYHPCRSTGKMADRLSGEVVPHLMPIIRELEARVAAKYDKKDVQIIDEWNRVHMAQMDMHYGFSVNGVAALHTEILKNAELKPFYDIYPEKFNNKTNGITFRRWLMHCDKKLVEGWIIRSQ